MANEYKACLRCGDTDSWEILELRRTDELPDGTRKFVYAVICTHCSRPSTFETDDPDAVPERQKVRDELFAGSGQNFDATKRWESDTEGFDGKIQPRLEQQ